MDAATEERVVDTLETMVEDLAFLAEKQSLTQEGLYEPAGPSIILIDCVQVTSVKPSIGDRFQLVD